MYEIKVVLQLELDIHQARHLNDERGQQMLRFLRLLVFPLTPDSDICTNITERHYNMSMQSSY